MRSHCKVKDKSCRQYKGLTHHSRQAGPEFKQDLALLRLLIEDVEPGTALQGAQPTQVGERREVQVLGLGHREAPDEEVKKAGVVHVYGGGSRVAGDRVNVACRGCRHGEASLRRCVRGALGPERGPYAPGPEPPRAPAPHAAPLRPRAPELEGWRPRKTPVFPFSVSECLFIDMQLILLFVCVGIVCLCS